MKKGRLPNLICSAFHALGIMSIAYWSQEIIQKQTCLYHHRVSKVIRREVPGTQPRESVGLVPSLISWNHLFYKAEYMGWSCPNQVGAITFGWSALATWNKHSWTAFWKLFSGIPHLPGFGDVPGTRGRHIATEFPGTRCFLPGDMKGGQVEYPWKGLSKCSSEMLILGW